MPDYNISLTNVSENETFRYSLPIIKGRVSGKHENGKIRVTRIDRNGRADRITSWPVADGHFTCLADLRPGRNKIAIEFCGAKLNVNFEFRPKTTVYHVLPVYIVCDGDEGRFQVPEGEDDSPKSACRRIALGSRMLQSLTAEKLHECGMTRRTFRLYGDGEEEGVGCIVFRSRLTSKEVYAMKPEEIWQHFGRELMSSSYGSEQRKFLAFLSCTRYSPEPFLCEPKTHEEVVARMRGHVALGGGGLAVFGTGCLHTWPETIREILSRFDNSTVVDKSKLMDDSCYRGTYGKCFSTTLGAVWHELGHAFDLGHSKTGIMGRGFDDVNLVFSPARARNRNRSDGQHATVSFTRALSVTYMPSSPIKPRQRREDVSPSNRSHRRSSVDINIYNNNYNTPNNCNNNYEEKKKTEGDDLTFWEKSCAVMLRYHRWFTDEGPKEVVSSMEFDRERNSVCSPEGIRVVELRGDDGLVLSSWEFTSGCPPKAFPLSFGNPRLKAARMVVAEDSSGNVLKENLFSG